jgi:hypothetical protein
VGGGLLMSAQVVKGGETPTTLSDEMLDDGGHRLGPGLFAEEEVRPLRRPVPL